MGLSDAQSALPPSGAEVVARGLTKVFYDARRGEVRAAFAYRRLREYPATGGPSTLRESMEHDDNVWGALALTWSF